MTKLVAAKSSELRLYDATLSSLTLLDTRNFDLNEDTINAANGGAAIWHPDLDKFYFEGNRSGPLYLCRAVVEANEIKDITPFSSGNQFGSPKGSFVTRDGTRMVITTGEVGGINTLLYDISGDVPSLLNSAGLIGSSVDLNLLSWLGGNRFISGAGFGANAQVIFDISGDVITEIAQGGIQDVSGVIPANTIRVGVDLFAEIINDVDVGWVMQVVSVENDTWSVVAQLAATNQDRMTAFRDGVFWSDDRAARFDGLTLEQITTGSFGTRVAYPFDGGEVIAVPAQNDLELRSVETGSDVLADSDGFGSTVLFVAGEPFYEGAGPVTPEEIFKATYASASAAPPKQTALVRPLDVQRSIDTDVSWLAGNPKDWIVDMHIDVGELDFYRPGNLFFVQDDQPGLRQGRKVLFKGFAASDIRPNVLVPCVFTAPTTLET